jgi:DNA modification methylase
MDSVAKKNYRSELLSLDWDFSGTIGSAGDHGYHWYPARYIPQIPGILIGYLSDAGNTILDPFCGSGTTLTEAVRLGRSAIGIDTNPVATLACQSKLLSVNPGQFSRYRAELEALALATAGALKSGRFDLADMVPNYFEQVGWYDEATLIELAAIWAAIEEATSQYEPIALASFSAILRFACSQDKHWGWICDNVKPRELSYRPALAMFQSKLDEYRIQTTNHAAKSIVVTGRCQDVLTKHGSRSIDCVVTSPPYYGTTDYARAQRLSFLWLEEDLETSRFAESGARFKRKRRNALSEFMAEMEQAFREVSRVLKQGGHCAVVIGESPKREPYLDDFCEMLETVDLRVDEQIERQLPRKRTLNPQLHSERIILCRKA